MANFNLNKVILGGRLTADPELKTTSNGVSVTTFTVAVNRRGKDEQSDFFNVTAWRQTAEFITRYFGKGSSICVSGVLQNRSWEKDGQKHYATEIVADEAYFVDSKDESTITANPPAARATNTPPSLAATPGAQQEFEEISDDEDLPF